MTTASTEAAAPSAPTTPAEDFDIVDSLHPVDVAGNAVAIAREVGRRAAPFAASHDREGTFVFEGYEAVRETGFGRLAVPRELGGGGHGLPTMCEALAVLARYCANTALAIAMHQHNVLSMAWRWRLGDDGVEPFLRRVVDDGLILSSSGTLNPERATVSGVPVEGGLRVSGRKAYCSGAPGADVMLVLARVQSDGRSLPMTLMVPLQAQGVEILPNWDALGMRGSGSNSVALTDVFVPDANIVFRPPPEDAAAAADGADAASAVVADPDGPGGDGTADAEPSPATASGAASRPIGNDPALARGMRMPGLHIALPMITAVYLGIAGRMRDRALRMVIGTERAQSAATHRLAGLMTQELRTGWWVLDSLVRETTDDTLGTQRQANATLLAKRQITLSSVTIVEAAMEMIGARSYMRDQPFEQALRDLRAAITHPLPPELTLTFVGRAALNWAADHPEAGEA
ncbi:MAG: acyl-CoA dehydrogenase family protein [Acidimicrobiales bacterium]|jgi:acyl-CoA dehydrogenase